MLKLHNAKTSINRLQRMLFDHRTEHQRNVLERTAQSGDSDSSLAESVPDSGAEMGNICMSLIHTCRLCDVNAFDYLNALRQRAQEMIDAPTDAVAAVELSRAARRWAVSAVAS